jgi:alanyl-tRNA synthetase
MPLEEARNLGAIAPFGEKYGALVRVVKIGDFSLEFCGGTHCRRTGEIGTFIIVNESSIASGVRRIESQTGMAAFEMLSNMRGAVRDLSRLLSATQDVLAERVENLLAETKEMKKEIKRLRQEKASGSVDDVLATAHETGGIRFVTHQTEGLDPNEMRNLADELRARLKEGVVVIGNTDGEKVSLVCTVTAGVKKKTPAGKIIREVAKIVGGSGGGRDDMAQAGGRFPEKLPEALAAVEKILKSILQ